MDLGKGAPPKVLVGKFGNATMQARQSPLIRQGIRYRAGVDWKLLQKEQSDTPPHASAFPLLSTFLFFHSLLNIIVHPTLRSPGSGKAIYCNSCTFMFMICSHGSQFFERKRKC